MKKYIKINNPCPEKWESMNDAVKGKFCEVCSQNVVDFTESTQKEIKNFIKKTGDQKICGRISSYSLPKLAAAILIANFTFVQIQAQTKINNKVSAGQHLSNISKLSGRLIFKETGKQIANAEVFFY